MGLMGRLIGFLSLPGVPLHEYAHAWACRRSGVRVQRVCYLRLGNPAGYVLHDRPDTALQQIFISTAPFLVCSLCSSLLGLFALAILQHHLLLQQYEAWCPPLLLWLGWAGGANAFPSGGDGDALWRSARSGSIGLFGVLLIVPVVGLIRLGQAGRRLWLDVWWGVVTAVAVPAMVLWYLGGAA